MNEEILKLANECGSTHKQSLGVYQFFKTELEAFYRAAYNKAIEDACEIISDSDDQLMGDFHIDRISKLEMK